MNQLKIEILRRLSELNRYEAVSIALEELKVLSKANELVSEIENHIRESGLSEQFFWKIFPLIEKWNKVQLVILIKQEMGIGLAESKNLADSIFDYFRDDSPLVLENNSSQLNMSTLDAELIQLLLANRKIEAVKLCMGRQQKGLLEAKDYVDALEARIKKNNF